MPRRFNDAIYKDSVGALLQQRSASGSERRPKDGGGPAAKNYRQDNRAAIKAIQEQNRQRKELEAAPAAEPFKMQQFKNIKSRVSSTPTPQSRASRADCTVGDASPRMTGHDFLRKGSREKVAMELRQEAIRRRQRDDTTSCTAITNAATAGSKKLFGTTTPRHGSTRYLATAPSTATPTPTIALATSTTGGRRASSSDLLHGYGTTPPSDTRDGENELGDGSSDGEGVHNAHHIDFSARGGGLTPRKDPVPRAADLAKLAPRSSRDFVASNRLQAAEMKAKAPTHRETRFTHDSYGKVPDYLLSRQEEWERDEERRKAEAPDPSCPPGMKLMPEEERLSTLRQLQENEAKCQNQLNTFPLVVQTPLLQRRVDELNAKLKEIDEAKAIFSRSRVYIARNS